ncbi:MAG: hypothetical protein WAT19_09610 [Ferruginibacter sp.]
MIPDKVFKELTHNHKGFQKLFNGQELEPGYKPDYVLKSGNEYIILESESSSSRKTYVGGMVKAAYFFRNNKKGKLIFVIVPKKNTKVVSIANHLKKYLNWLDKKTNLCEVYIIEANKYYNDGQLLALDCDEFFSCALKV